MTVQADPSATPAVALNARQTERAVVNACADEIDARTADGATKFLEVLVEGDREDSLAAIAYEQTATKRFAAALEALEPADSAPLDRAVAAVEARGGEWVDRKKLIEDDPDLFLEGGTKAAVAIVKASNGATMAWIRALEAMGVESRECSAALP